MKLLKKAWFSFLFTGLLIFTSACAQQAGNGTESGIEQPPATSPVDTTPTVSAPTETAKPQSTPDATKTPAGSDELTGTKWYLVSFGSADAENAAVPGSDVTIEFMKGGSAGGHAGCNSYSGSYTLDNGSLTFSDFISTLMACLDDDITRQEGLYLQALQKAEGYQINGDTLIIYYGDGQEQITYSRSVPPSESSGNDTPVKVVQMLDALTGWAVGAGNGESALPILFTADGGLTWDDRSPQGVVYSSDFGSATPAFYFESAVKGWVSYPMAPGQAAGEQPVIWFTQDGGQSWATQPIDTGAIPMDNFSPSDFGFINSQLGWMVAHLGAGMSHDYIAIYQTDNGGATWQRVSDPDRNFEVQACPKTGLGFVNASEGWLAADCPGLMPQLSLYHTLDGGASWEAETLPLPEGLSSDLDGRMGDQCGISTLWVDPLGITRLALRCFDYDSGEAQSWLYSLAAVGQGWQSATLPVPYGELDFIDEMEGWYLAAGLQDFSAPKELFHTTDGGLHWKSIAQDLYGNLVDFTDPLNGWIASGEYGDTMLLHTTDGGQNWE